MAAFGVGFGDLVASINLIIRIISVFRECGGAGAEYRELAQDLDHLEKQLLELQELGIDGIPKEQLEALRPTTSTCLRAIEGFWKKISKYSSHLSVQGSGSRIKDNFMKIQWAMCRKEDLISFRAQLREYITTINFLLIIIHMKTSTRRERRSAKWQQSVLNVVHEHSLTSMELIKTVAGCVTELLSCTKKNSQTNEETLQVVLAIRQQLTQIPNQVQLTQPVYLVDAFGEVTAFHLDFITSSRTLEAVLVDRFMHAGLPRWFAYWFSILDSKTEKPIDFHKPWEQCFRPGQQVEMCRAFLPICPMSRESRHDRICLRHIFYKRTAIQCHNAALKERETLRQLLNERTRENSDYYVW